MLADRLESQEREIERLKEELEQMEEAATVLHAANETHWTYIKELTARAEQAEATMKAIVDVIDSGSVVCTICANRVGWDTCKPCKFKLRGQPQDGEGKK